MDLLDAADRLGSVSLTSSGICSNFKICHDEYMANFKVRTSHKRVKWLVDFPWANVEQVMMDEEGSDS